MPFLPVGRASSNLAQEAAEVAGATPVSESQQGPEMRRLMRRSSRQEEWVPKTRENVFPVKSEGRAGNSAE
jgi:hypothetical protein